MQTNKIQGQKLAWLWLAIAAAFAVALRRGSLVPWGSGTGPGRIGAPLWALAPIFVVLILTALVTVYWWRTRRAT
jgi:hypothetical protein